MSPSSEEEVEESFGALAEGGIERAGGVPPALRVDAFGVAERVEALDVSLWAGEMCASTSSSMRRPARRIDSTARP
jgi:hypothetical protein